MLRILRANTLKCANGREKMSVLAQNARQVRAVKVYFR